MCLCAALCPGQFQDESIPLWVPPSGDLWCGTAQSHRFWVRISSWFICLKILVLLSLLRPVELKVGCCSASLNLLSHLHVLSCSDCFISCLLSLFLVLCITTTFGYSQEQGSPRWKSLFCLHTPYHYFFPLLYGVSSKIFIESLNYLLALCT